MKILEAFTDGQKVFFLLLECNMKVIRLAVRLVRDGLVVATADQLDGVWNQLE